jgi:hypothetical protein
VEIGTAVCAAFEDGEPILGTGTSCPSAQLLDAHCVPGV